MLDQLMDKHPETTLVIADSVSKLLHLAGLEEDNAGSLKLWTVFERFIAKHPQVAVLLIDHQGHGGSGHARGATVKAQQSSIVVQLSSVTKFAKDRNGQVKAKIHKHRNGESTGHTWQGDVIVSDGTTPLRVDWADLGTDGDGAPEVRKSSKPNATERLILAFQRRKGEWLTVGDLQLGAQMARSTVQNSLRELGSRVEDRPDPDSTSKAKQYRLARS